MTDTVTAGPLDKRREVARRLAALTAPASPHPYHRWINPDVGDLLDGLGLDVAFVRGEGSTLYDADGRGYLDFAGAYGALPFGHNPPGIWQAIDALHRTREPSLTQPSLLTAAGDLAQALLAVAPPGLTRAWFCNSGAEAVEAAIKLARAATGRPMIVSTVDAFHGKTLGALSATGRPRYQHPFGAPATGFTHVPFGETDALERMFSEHPDRIAGFLIEPIQGEAGIRPAPPGYLQAARELCDKHGALLIVDEVQTGLGRTGRLFAVEHDGVTPDIMPLAKALGGGLVPIGAVLYNAAAASEDFAFRHTSTFGGNAFCARVGLRSLDLLLADDQALIRSVAARGDQLATGLRRLADRHPQVITDVRGRGLLLGLEISANPDDYPRQGLLRSLAAQEGLAAFLCGHLLRSHGIRLAPTYFAGSTLRVEPPLTITAQDCDRFLHAVTATVDSVAAGDSAAIFGHLLPHPPVPHPAHPAPVSATTPVRPRAGEPRWAFVVHPTDAESYRSFDPALQLPGSQVRALFDRMNRCRNIDGPGAMFVGRCRVHTAIGDTSYGEFYALPRSARDLMDLPSREATALVQEAVDQAVAAGAQAVGLGAYTSIVTRNAEALRDVGVPITTGNAYTAAAAVDGVGQAADLRGMQLSTADCAVLGAPGAIGRATTLLLAPDVGSLHMVGNPLHRDRSMHLLGELGLDIIRHLRLGPAAHGALARRAEQLADVPVERAAQILRQEGFLTVGVDSAAAVAAADVVVAATSTPDQLITADDPRPNAIICDVSQPANVRSDVRTRRPDLLVVDGGLVRLPGDRPLEIDLGVPAGVTYACAAETMILAHRLADPRVSRGGRLDPLFVQELRDAGARLGFALHLPDAPAATHG